MKRLRFANLSLRDKGLVVVALPVVSLFVTLLILAYVQRQIEDADEMIRHTFEVRSAIQTVSTLLMDAETGVRGYLLTGRREWLGSHDRAARQLPEVLDRLESLVQDNPAQLQRVRQTRSLATERLRRLAEFRPRRSYTGPRDLQSRLVAGNDLMNSVRALLDETRLTEDRLLAGRTARAEQMRNRMYLVILGSILFGLMGGVLAADVFSGTVVRRIEWLKKNAQLLAERRPLVHAPIDRDELGELAQALAKADVLLGERERKLRETEGFLQHIIETSPTIVFVQDPASGMARYVSPNVERVLGYTPVEIMRTPDFWGGHTHPDDLERVLAEKRAALDRNAPQLETEYRIRHRDGEYCWMRTFLRYEYDEAGQPVSILGHRLDITARRRAEEALLERQAHLDAANKELEAFSYSVSHDLRAPLRGIDGFSLALLEDYGSRLDQQGQDYLNRVRAATQRMGSLIDDMLALSRVTRAPLNRQEIDLSLVAGQIAGELEEQNPTRQVELDIQPDVTAYADASLMRAVLENLIGNAWKFTSHTPDARIAFGMTRNGNAQPVYYVRDNGAGFNPEYASKLFGAFQRLHTQQEFPGSGVGLATVQRILHRHGGRVWAEGKVREGAAFYFTLGS